jgi:phosphatidylglycerophosphatase A
MKRRFVQLIATFFYLGYSPIAPGTAGTLGALLPFYLLSHFSHPIYFLFMLGFIILAIWVSAEACISFGENDPNQVVADEVCGYLVTMFLVPAGIATVVLGFFLFRFFDIVKPFPIRRLERLPGGFGIVADDVAAGIYANVLLQIITGFFG